MLSMEREGILGVHLVLASLLHKAAMSFQLSRRMSCSGPTVGEQKDFTTVTVPMEGLRLYY